MKLWLNKIIGGSQRTSLSGHNSQNRLLNFVDHIHDTRIHVHAYINIKRTDLHNMMCSVE